MDLDQVPVAPTVAMTLTDATERLHVAGSETARLDAEVLLAFVLRLDRSGLMAHPEARLTTGQQERFAALLERRADGEPVAYIRGLKEFYGVVMTVDARVLIPRPASEALVEAALECIRDALTDSPRPEGAGPLVVWDVGTGSGAIPVAIASELRRRGYGDAVRYHLSDVSPAALEVALINVVAHGVADLMTLAEGDLLDAHPQPSGPVDLITANLPYIPSADVPALPRAASYEPAEALDGGEDGLDIVRRLLSDLPAALAPTGRVLLEIGADQVERVVAAVAAALPGWGCTIEDDLSGSPRVAVLDPASDPAEDA